MWLLLHDKVKEVIEIILSDVKSSKNKKKLKKV